jgi:hypothetical protein
LPARRATRTWVGRFTGLELIVFATFALCGAGVFVLNLVNAHEAGRLFLGADSQLPNDQTQYLAWATDAGHHILIANLYGLHAGNHVFLDPAWLLTGLLHVRVGLSYPLVLAGWKVIAVVALFLAVRAYARSLLPEGRRAVAAMILGLFMVSAGYVLANRLQGSGAGLINGETFAVYMINGYFPIALAVAAMIVFLLEADALVSRPETEPPEPRRVLLAAAAGMTASWLHPWQGITLLIIVAGLVLWERARWRRHLRLIVPVLATVAPVVYFAVLPHIDTGWAIAEHTWREAVGGSFTAKVVIQLLPLVAIALPGYAIRAVTPAERMLWLWPLATVLVYLLAPADKFHALGGCSVPLAVLTARGWPWLTRRLRISRLAWARWIVAGALAAVMVAAAPFAVAQRMLKFRQRPEVAAQIPDDDARALQRVDALPETAGVLTTAALGVWVPALTDHRTWVGHQTWTPSYASRAGAAARLFSGRLDGDPARERRMVLDTGATVVLVPCGSRARLGSALEPAGFRVADFGCATLLLR